MCCTHAYILFLVDWLPQALRCRQQLGCLGKLGRGYLFPLLLQKFFSGLLQEFWCGPLFHVKIILDVAVPQHEVLADLNGDQVLRRQVGHHVNVLDALVCILDVQVECLLVEFSMRFDF
jgi:hypothetical protein